jgi:hypothetical protein
MMQIQFRVVNQSITRTDSNKVVAGSKNYLHASFDFSSDWNNQVKTAVFINNDQVFNQILDETDTCMVPWEVITPGKLRVSVFAGDLITVDKAIVDISESGYIEGQTPTPPTPDVYSQILDKLKNLQAGEISDEQISKAINEYLAENPISGVNEEEVQTIVTEYISANKEELKGDKGDTGERGADGKSGKDGENGKDGFSPTATVTKEGNISTLTVTDKNGTTSVKILDGADGKDGTNGSGSGVIDTRILTSINATKTKTNYNVDEEINIDDIVVIATYMDGTTSEVSGWTSNIDEVDTFTDGYKKLEISYYHNGVTKITSIPLNVNFSNTVDNIQYGYCITDRGRLVNNTNVVKLTTKLLKRSVVNIRMKVKVVIERNSNSGYTTLGFGNYNIWKSNSLASIVLNPKQMGEFIIECNKEVEYEQPNLQVENGNDTILLSVYNNGGNKVDGFFEILDYSISVTQEAPLVVESISATKAQTRYIIGEDVDTSDIVVTALMSDDTNKTVDGFTTELDVDNIDDYGKTPLSVIYTENGINNTTTITLRMYKAFLTEPQSFEDITAHELHDRLGLGINIGNCLDSKATTTENVSVCSYDGWLNQETA